MLEKQMPIHRPRIVTIVSAILAVYAFIGFLILVSGGILFILQFQYSGDNQSGKGFAILIMLIGSSLFILNFNEARLFYSLNRIGFDWVKIQIKVGIPDVILWLVTNRGKRLNDKDVRDAFGLRDVEF